MKKLVEKYGLFVVITGMCSVAALVIVVVSPILAHVGPFTKHFMYLWDTIQMNSEFIVIISLLIFIILLLSIVNRKGKPTRSETMKFIKKSEEMINKSMSIFVEDLKKINTKYNSICEECSKIKEFYKEQKTVGIHSIKPATDYNDEYFKKLYNGTYKTLSITAHTLNKTIGNRTDVKSAFKKAVLRVLGDRGAVKILLQTVNEHNKDLLQKRKNVIRFVQDIYKSIDSQNISDERKQDMKDNFLLKEVTNIPYYIVQNEETTLLAHYRAKGNSGLYVFCVDERRGYGEFYLSDFEHEFSSAKTIPIS
ncbi:MAG: hypothetical protein FWD44_00145 [Oscillospiraceae bacterium]|nr:hypothetical protein [Oscillospiraceae bacterium]